MFKNAIALYKSGLGSAYTCVAYAFGCRDQILDIGVMGNRTEDPSPIPADRNTLFDLASLSKLVGTTMVALRLMEEGKLLLVDTVGRYLPDAKGTPFEDVTVFRLMTHTSGVNPALPLWKLGITPEETVNAILHSKPVCEAGEEVYYSCMGYMLLQAILETITGKRLDALVREYVTEPLGMKNTCYLPTTPNVAATEISPLTGERICGFVHDENAHWRGGVSGNAGVFSDVEDMARFACMIANRGVLDGKMYLTPRTFEKAIANYTPDKCEGRGLGFQMTSDISYLTGDFFRENSYGHTGYTGTALYADKDNGFWSLMLTNSVYLGRGDNKLQCFRLRRAACNAAISDFLRA